MKRIYVAMGLGAAIAVSTLLCTSAFAQDADGPRAAPAGAATGTTSDVSVDRHRTQAFIDRAVYASRAEIAEARYVGDHTKSQAVKDFVKQMIDDHTAALRQLEHIASSHGFMLPAGIDVRNRDSLDELEKDRGARLDLAYSSDQEKGHEAVIEQFQRAAADSSIARAVRDYARQALPVLRDHLRMAEQLVASEAKGNRPAG